MITKAQTSPYYTFLLDYRAVFPEPTRTGRAPLKGYLCEALLDEGVLPLLTEYVPTTIFEKKIK